jgi:hypothetical protein
VYENNSTKVEGRNASALLEGSTLYEKGEICITLQLAWGKLERFNINFKAIT